MDLVWQGGGEGVLSFWRRSKEKEEVAESIWWGEGIAERWRVEEMKRRRRRTVWWGGRRLLKLMGRGEKGGGRGEGKERRSRQSKSFKTSCRPSSPFSAADLSLEGSRDGEDDGKKKKIGKILTGGRRLRFDRSKCFVFSV